MRQRDSRLTRRELRQGSGTDVENEHFDEVLGSSEFYIYVTPNKKAKGYDALKQYVESVGCEAEYPAVPQLVDLGDRYQAVKITKEGELIPSPVLRRAHRWAHQRNFLHSFFKPLFEPHNPSA